MSTVGIGKLGTCAAGATALMALVAGCSSSSAVKPAASGASTSREGAPMGAAATSGLTTRSTSIGTVLVDPAGRTVYELVGDSAANPSCTGSCLAAWPAVKVNGTQVVLNGHPAFTFVQDSAPGDVQGQNLKDQFGLWLALDASGNPIKTAAPPSKASGGGGAAS